MKNHSPDKIFKIRKFGENGSPSKSLVKPQPGVVHSLSMRKGLQAEGIMTHSVGK
jgi:hypothetical protein